MIIRRLPFLVVVATTGFVLHNGGGQRRQTTATATATATASTTTIAFVIPHSSIKRRRRHSHPRAATTSTAATSVTHTAHEQQYDIPIIDNDIPIIDDDIPIIDIPIIYEDEYLLAINKPHNISHHDDPSTNQLGILSHIRLQQQQQRQRQQQTSNEQQQQPTKLFPYPHRLYGVHRLDRVTSGILLLAKDSATANALMEKFAKREITKYYAAISARKATKKKQGWVKGAMGMGRRGSYRLLSNSEKPLKGKKREARETKGEDGGDDGGDGGDNEGGKKKKKGGYAVTRFYTAGLGKLSLSPPLSSDDADGDDDTDEGTVVPKTAIVFRPHTGKTHQLRVAAKSVSLPILGDVRYGGGRLRAAAALAATTAADRCDNADDDATTHDDSDDGGDYDRTYLHASAVHFRMNDERDVTIYSPPPFDHLFSTDDEEALTNVFASLMEKHCDCIPILNVIREREKGREV